MGLRDKVTARLESPASGSMKDRSSKDSRAASSSSDKASKGAAPTAPPPAPKAAPAAPPARPPPSAPAPPEAPPVPAAPGSASEPTPARFERQYSTASWNTVSTLQQFELEVIAMEKQVKDHAETLAQPPPEGLPLKMRNELAQLHGDFNRILDTKIDAILTSELNSGKQDARAKRKELSAKCGTIIEEIEVLVKKYDSMREAAKSV